MVGFLSGSINLSLDKVHSIDKVMKTLKSVDLSSRTVRDGDFGNQGEKITSIPQIQNITIEELESTECERIAQDVIGGKENQTISGLTFARLSSNSIIGVKNDIN